MSRNPKHGTTQFVFLALLCGLLLSFTPSSSVRGQSADRASAASPDKLGPGRFIPPEGKPEAVNIDAPAAAPAGCQLFDFESGDGGFTVEGVASALWHVSDVCRANLAGHSATHTFYYGQDATCNYDNGARNASNLISPNIGVVGAQTISFNYLLFVESSNSFDTANVDYSTNNGATWTPLLTKANFINDNQWHNISVDVSAILANANSVRLRFRFDSVDNLVNSSTGWHVDDVQVCGGAPLRPWTTEGSVGTLDTASASIGAFSDFGFSLATGGTPGSGTSKGTAIARYNITAVDGVGAFCPATQSNVWVRFRNQDNSGATSSVSFTINARSIATGAKSTLFTFTSNGRSVPGQQSTLATFTPAIDFDFAHNTYWIEATVFASKPQQANLSPALQSVQIWESEGTPCQ